MTILPETKHFVLPREGLMRALRWRHALGRRHALHRRHALRWRHAPGRRHALRRRQAQRGAALFIIMMAIVLLSGLGMWSMYSAGLVDQASGYSRAARQSQFAAELGILSSTAYLSLPGQAQANWTNATDPCESASGQRCKRLDLMEINQATQLQSARDVIESGGSSFGPVASGQAGALEGQFFVEMTDMRKAYVPGDDFDQPQYHRFTFTSYGLVRPDAGVALCDPAAAGENTAASRLAVRAHAIVGPIR